MSIAIAGSRMSNSCALAILLLPFKHLFRRIVRTRYCEMHIVITCIRKQMRQVLSSKMSSKESYQYILSEVTTRFKDIEKLQPIGLEQTRRNQCQDRADCKQADLDKDCQKRLAVQCHVGPSLQIRP